MRAPRALLTTITLGGPPGGAQHQQQGDLGGVQMRGVTWKQRTGAVGEIDQLIGGVDMIVRIEQRLIVAAKARLDGLGQFARDHDFWLRAQGRILQWKLIRGAT